MSPHVAGLPRTTPESVGVSSAAVLAFVDALETQVGGLHSFMLLRHGQVAAEGWWAPYAPHLPHALFSLSKSFTSTAVGLAVEEGLLTVDDPVVSFFPDRLPAEVSENLRAMRVRHLLSMSTGQGVDATEAARAAPDGDWARAFLALPVIHAPGSTFAYNSAATYMCSAIVQSLTGQTVLDYLRPRLFEPLGIRNPTWETCPRGVTVGGWGLSITTEDIARFGELYLRNGVWNGRRLVPAEWVREATSKQVSNGDGGESDWAQGYGFQFWRCRHNAYRGDGAFGQYCVVMPEQDAVLAITGGIGDLQATLDAAWDCLLPGMQPASPAPPNPDLARRLSNLAIPAPAGSAASETAARVSGVAYVLEPNAEGLRSVTFRFGPEGAAMTLCGGDGEQTVPCSHDRWAEADKPAPMGRIVARGAWSAPDTFTVARCYYEMPFLETFDCRFHEGGVAISRRINVSFGPTDRPPLTGTARP